jgi:tetratricopeptide (TPR) repeat protein
VEPTVHLHAFVVMPFGVKKGWDGADIDFDRIYTELIEPALAHAGFIVFRADREQRGGDIRPDMFQELLIADLVVADLTIDNPNVWYELGVRHALRARGVVLIQGERPYQPFDTYTDRKVSYRIEAGGPDPATLAADRKRIAETCLATVQAWHGRKASPVYQLLPNLREPDWKSLRVGDVMEFWEEHEAWEQRVRTAKRMGRVGDILVLAAEAPTRAFRLEACRTAGSALRALGRLEFAIEQYEQALELEPADPESRRQKGMLLGKLGRLEAAREWFADLLQDDPGDGEAWAMAARLEKDAWVAEWRAPGKAAAELRADAAASAVLLREAIDRYARGFDAAPLNYYAGINAVASMQLLRHLTGETDYDKRCADMAGGVRWAASREPKNYWARATVADLEVLQGEPAAVQSAYQAAVAVAQNDWFAVDSTRQQLLMLRDLEFRPPQVAKGIEVLERALAKIKAPSTQWAPQRVFLYSGHMIDAPGRAQPRFPPDKEPLARRAIVELFDRLQPAASDLAIGSAACGGDLLFAEECIRRGTRVALHIGFEEPAFLKDSVSFAGGDWLARYTAVRDCKDPDTTLLVMPDELGPCPKPVDPYERLNLWLLYSALAWGPEKVHFVCLWNGKGGDGPGGTAHMYREVQSRTGQVYWLDTTKLWTV